MRASITRRVIASCTCGVYGRRMTVGPLIREWRSRRRLSQLELSSQLGVSARHLSFVETGRGRASRTLVLRLAEHLDLPFRARDELLLAAGFAPAFGRREFDDAAMEPVRRAISTLLAAHEPNPAITVDEHWNVVFANRGCGVLLEGVDPDLLADAPNVMRLTLHPRGLAPRIANLGEVRASLLGKVRRAAMLSGEERLEDLHAELASYSDGPDSDDGPPADDRVLLPIRVRTGDDTELNLLSTVTTFGTPLDTTVAGLSMESFLPADEPSAAYLRARFADSDSQVDRLVEAYPALADYVAKPETRNPR